LVLLVSPKWRWCNRVVSGLWLAPFTCSAYKMVVGNPSPCRNSRHRDTFALPTKFLSHTNSPLQYVADISLTEELFAEARLEDVVASRLLGDSTYSSGQLQGALAEMDIYLATERSQRRPKARADRERFVELQERVRGWTRCLRPRWWCLPRGSRPR
jgi:hypothetical protein